MVGTGNIVRDKGAKGKGGRPESPPGHRILDILILESTFSTWGSSSNNPESVKAADALHRMRHVQWHRNVSRPKRSVGLEPRFAGTGRGLNEMIQSEWLIPNQSVRRVSFCRCIGGNMRPPTSGQDEGSKTVRLNDLRSGLYATLRTPLPYFPDVFHLRKMGSSGCSTFRSQKSMKHAPYS